MPTPPETRHPPASVAGAVTSVLQLVIRGAALAPCLDELCQQLQTTCAVDVTAAFTLDQGRWQLAGESSLPASLVAMTDEEAVQPGSLMERAVTRREPTWCDDVTTLDPTARRPHELAIEAGLRGILCVPVTGASGNAHGVLALGTLAAHRWTEDTVDLTRAFADLAGLVLERHRARVRAERSTQRANRLSHRLASILDAVPTPTFELDQDGRVSRWNRAAAIVVGWRADDLVGWPLTAMGQSWTPLLARVDDARRGVGSTSQVEVVRRDGTPLVLEVRLNPLIEDHGTTVIGTITDLTDRLAMETAIRRSQRMEALGQFAGGMAHDFGNILSAIAGYADLLEMELPEDASGPRTDAARIREVAERGRALTERLLDFAHSRPTVPVEVDVAAEVRDLERLLARSLPGACSLVLEVDDVPPVMLGEGQLDRVLLNLVSNAGDAMPDGGTVTVRVHAVDDRVVLEVEDQGRGIPQPLLDRIFEPFFTTKGARGNGLGLANVYAIVRGAGGHVAATSRVDRGTRFRLELPARRRDTVADAGARDGRRILVVDPEPVSRQVLRTALHEAGFRVMAVADAEDIDLADVARTDPVHLIVCPATAGTPADRRLASLLQRVRRLHPTVALVELGARDESSRDPGVTSIPRPYLVDQVLAAVRRALPSPPGDQPSAISRRGRSGSRDPGR